MQLVEKEHFCFIEDFFAPNVCAGFTRPTFSGAARDLIPKILDFFSELQGVAYLEQMHAGDVRIVDTRGCYRGDGIFTDRENLMVVVQTADCLPLFFSSVSTGTIGVVHMGWRSAQAGILDNTPRVLHNFKVAAGVGLRQCCFAVGPEFKRYRHMKRFLEFRGRLYFDPVAFAQATLTARGLASHDFTDIALCSLCSEKRFPSYRRNQTPARTLSFIFRNDRKKI